MARSRPAIHFLKKPIGGLPLGRKTCGESITREVFSCPLNQPAKKRDTVSFASPANTPDTRPSSRITELGAPIPRLRSQDDLAESLPGLGGRGVPGVLRPA